MRTPTLQGMKGREQSGGSGAPGRRSHLLGWLAAALAGLGLAGPAAAVQIVVTPDFDDTFVGGTVAFDVEARELGSNVVSAFDLDLSFDPAVLGFKSLAFGPSFGGAAGSFSGAALTGSGRLDFFLFSLLSDDALAAAQGGSARLARIVFTGLAPGRSALEVPGVGSDAFFRLVGREGRPLAVDGIAGGFAEVIPRTPEPGPLALMGLGLLAIGVVWRRRNRRQR